MRIRIAVTAAILVITSSSNAWSQEKPEATRWPVPESLSLGVADIYVDKPELKISLLTASKPETIQALGSWKMDHMDMSDWKTDSKERAKYMKLMNESQCVRKELSFGDYHFRTVAGKELRIEEVKKLLSIQKYVVLGPIRQSHYAEVLSPELLVITPKTVRESP